MLKKKKKDLDTGRTKTKLRFDEYTTEQAEKDEAELSSRGNYGKIGPGKNVIRVLPARPGESWKLKFYKHFVDVNGQAVAIICPFLQTKGKRKCKICRKIKTLQESGDPTDMAKAERIQAQVKVKIWAIDRNDEEAGPKEYELSPGVAKKLTDFRKVDGVDFTHPKKGCDITIIKTGAGRTGTKYKPSASRDTTPLHEDHEVMAEWINNLEPLKVNLESDEDIDARLRGEDPRENRDKRRGKSALDDDEDDESLGDDDLIEDDEDDDEPPARKKKKKARVEDDDDEEIDF
jgi:hypothetical protein